MGEISLQELEKLIKEVNASSPQYGALLGRAEDALKVKKGEEVNKRMSRVSVKSRQSQTNYSGNAARLNAITRNAEDLQEISLQDLEKLIQDVNKETPQYGALLGRG